MPLTLANLKCIKGNPLKFFYIEFLFTKICDNNGNPICVSDIVINGNIQIVIMVIIVVVVHIILQQVNVQIQDSVLLIVLYLTIGLLI